MECNLPNDVESLSTACIQSTTLLQAAILDCLSPLWYLKCNADRQVLTLVEQLMAQITRCYKTCFGGLNEICGTILGRKARFGVINCMISFFGMALKHLHTLCSIQAEREISSSQQRLSTYGVGIQEGHVSKRARTNGEASGVIGKI